ncbi:MAG TPA: hypothetical protein GXX57_08450 [Firmicutes bacterium]|nr:hypothetical protein [Bacillota bacterium]
MAWRDQGVAIGSTTQKVEAAWRLVKPRSSWGLRIIALMRYVMGDIDSIHAGSAHKPGQRSINYLLKRYGKPLDPLG